MVNRKLFCILALVMAASFLAGCASGSKQEVEKNVKKIDMIMWYDIDYGSIAGSLRAERGWDALNPQHPETVTASGPFRSTTPLLGLYDGRDPKMTRQHCYWLSALGCGVVAMDWTNYYTYRDNRYGEGIFRNTETFFKTLGEITEYAVPKVYITLRLEGVDYEYLKKEIEDVWELYSQYPQHVYKLDDGTENADKPFLVIFADGTELRAWKDREIPFKDDRFNIRWSNGFIGAVVEDDKDGYGKIAKENPYWLFVQNEKDTKKEGYYKTFYKEGRDGKVEQMIGWASVWEGGTLWDKLNHSVDGKTTFERTIVNVEKLRPKALLVCRFNYAKAWREEPQEGVSLYGSTHIEPNQDFGFLVFDNVAKNLYQLNRLKAEKPPLPKVDDSLRSTLFSGHPVWISYDGYPLEYRFSLSGDMENSAWRYFNVNEGITLPEGLRNNDAVICRLKTVSGKVMCLK